MAMPELKPGMTATRGMMSILRKTNEYTEMNL